MQKENTPGFRCIRVLTMQSAARTDQRRGHVNLSCREKLKNKRNAESFPCVFRNQRQRPPANSSRDFVDLKDCAVVFISLTTSERVRHPLSNDAVLDALPTQKTPMKNKSQLVRACIAAFASYAMAVSVFAAEPPSAPATDTETSTAIPGTADARETRNTTERTIPFRGTISATDEKAKTFTIAGKEKSRIFRITEKTLLTKAGVPATMKDVVVNEEVRGSYSKGADGTLEARLVKLGPKTDAEKSVTKKQSRKKGARSGLPVSSSNSVSAKP